MVRSILIFILSSNFQCRVDHLIFAFLTLSCSTVYKHSQSSEVSADIII